MTREMKPLEENNFNNANMYCSTPSLPSATTTSATGHTPILIKHSPKSYGITTASTVHSPIGGSSLTNMPPPLPQSSSFDCYTNNAITATTTTTATNGSFNFLSKENHHENSNDSYLMNHSVIDHGSSQQQLYSSNSGLSMSVNIDSSKNGICDNTGSGQYIPPPSLSNFIHHSAFVNSGSANKKSKKSSKDFSKLQFFFI
jgi:hypothetical protein